MVTMRVILFTILTILVILFISNHAGAETRAEITSIFSDEHSMDITIHSLHHVEDVEIVFSLIHDDNTIQSRTLNLDLEANSMTNKVIMWDIQPQFETYVATASILIDGELVDEASYPFSYGLVAFPRFQVVDLSASNSGVNLMLKPRNSLNPSVADFTFQLIRNNDIIYTETKEDVPVIQSTQVSINWPILLEDHTDYMARVKALSHTPDIISSYVTEFTSGQDVEIDETDVEVDDFGVSVTLYGKSQVPFDGIVEVELNKDGAETIRYTGRPEILTLNRDDTVGIIWDELDAGTYRVNILVKTLDDEILDRYETVLLIPERSHPITQPVKPQTPGFGAALTIVGIIVVALSLRKP
jgi:hypothetical protein